MSGPAKIDARLLKRLPAAGDTDAFELNIHLKSDAAVTVLWGASGAGKTLTLHCLSGFSKPDEGRILVNDELLFDAATAVNLPPSARRCGYIFQEHALFPHMTVRENLKFAAAAARNSSRLNKHRRMIELLEAFELTDLAGRKPAQLSTGEKQRAALARMLVGDPRLLLLDEPTRGLDARLRQAFYAVLRTTRERSQAPIVLVTHDLEECMQLGDFVCLMESGHFVQSGPRELLFARPANADVARTLGIYNLLPAKVTALDPSRDTCVLDVAGSEVQGRYLKGRLIGDQGYLCVRQTEARLLPNLGRREPNQIVLRVAGVSPSAQGTRVLLEHGAAAIVSEAEYALLRGESTLKLDIPSAAVYFIAK
jgi:ABC-type sulfate/molybdate transport systems ATPase subunit